MEAAGNIGAVDESQVMAELHKKWKTLMALGMLALFAGLVCILVPAFASPVIGLFVGWLLVFGGVLQLIDAFAVKDGGRQLSRGIGALLTLGIGIWIVASDYHGTHALTVVLAIWFLASGSLRLIAGLVQRGTPGASLVIVNGVLSLILGGMILGDLPSSADWALGLLVGIDLTFAGIALITTASAAKNAG